MEILGMVNLPTWLVCIIMTVMTVCLYTWYKQSYFKRLGIHTKPTVFFLGDMFELSKKGFGYIDDQMVKENGKIFGLYLGNIPTLVISDTDIIKQIMVKDFSKFTDRVSLVQVTKKWKSAVSVASGEHWRFLRTTLSPTFTTGKIREMKPYIHKCMKTLLELLSEKTDQNPEGFNIVPNLSGYTLDVICSTGFGLDVDAQKDPDNLIIRYAREFLEFRGLRNPLFLVQMFFPDLSSIFGRLLETNIVSNEAFDFYMSTMKKAFTDRKQAQSKHRDLLQLLINTHKGELGENEIDTEETTFEGMKQRGLTDEEVLLNSIIFMVAGYDTTATTLSWIVYDLVTNTECQEKLIEEIDAEIGESETTYDNVFKLRYLDMVVNETLRMHPPAQRINRLALEDVKINGLQILKGMDCTFSILALHYMPEYWENPYKYDPERFAPENQANINQYAYMPFGQGPRNCIGKRLALLEVKATVVVLLQKFRLHKTDKLQVPMPVSDVGLGKPAKPVFVRLEKRSKN
uniref:Cytochrome P450 30 n=1 Tax=Mercenaria mercenaria TaxID=6596 RepID=O16156_MERMC|nr:cytochrome P450 30 [Mercenaria mercenaria]